MTDETKPQIRDGMTYGEVAALLGVRVDTLYTKVARNPDWGPATFADGKRRFTADQVRDMLEHQAPTEGIPMRELVKKLEEITGDSWSDALVRYYQNRYGLLLPKLYGASPRGRGRSTAYFTDETIDEFRRWHEGGRPKIERVEDDEQASDGATPAAMSLDDEVMVDPAPGITVKVQVGNVQVALTDSGWRTSPSVPEDELESYVERAKERIDKVLV